MSGLDERLSAELAELDRIGRRRVLPGVSGRQGCRIEYRGRTMSNLSSNDYLGLGGDAALPHAFRERFGDRGLDGVGMTASSSRLLVGNHPAYVALERELRALYEGRAVCVFNSGYHANVGICATLAGKGDLVLCDKLDHASILDGVRLSGATFRRYRHRDLDHLEQLLKRGQGAYRQVFVISETVFSMDGDVADVERLVHLKESFDAVLILDEAHGVGVRGDRGLGLCEECGMLERVDVIVGTFGKALASLGAFAVTSEVTRDYLVNRMRPLIFTTALPPAVVNWTRFMLGRTVAMRTERLRLAELATRLRRELADAGLETGGTSQIVPVVLGPDAVAIRTAAALRDAGYLALPIRPPTVPPGTARLRLSLCANMDWNDIAGLVPVIRNEVEAA